MGEGEDEDDAGDGKRGNSRVPRDSPLLIRETGVVSPRSYSERDRGPHEGKKYRYPRTLL